MYNNTNPAELYSGTTWELLASDKYIRTGATPLSTGGSNFVNIGKVNLPNIKLKIDSFTITRGSTNITGWTNIWSEHFGNTNSGGALYTSSINTSRASGANNGNSARLHIDASKSWSGTFGTASPNTESLGSGTALSIQPAYITLKFWKRLS